MFAKQQERMIRYTKDGSSPDKQKNKNLVNINVCCSFVFRLKQMLPACSVHGKWAYVEISKGEGFFEGLFSKIKVLEAEVWGFRCF